MTSEKIHTLIVKYLTGEASADESEELSAWLSESAENRNTFRSMKDAFDLGRFETDVKNADTPAEWRKLRKRIAPSAEKPVRRINPFREAMRYAAIFVLGLLCMKAADLLRTDTPPEPEKFVTRVETGKSERTKVILPDSTVVWLNACSSISYDQDFGNETRKVDLKGEAFFEVRHNTGKPFLVHADDLTYRVTGTSFNVYSFDNDNIASLVLVEGSVLLEYGDYVTKIAPGELVEFDKTARKIYRKQTDTAFYTGWRFGELAFEKMKFEELAQRLERNFNVVFKIQNEKVKKQSFGGTFRHYDSLETILQVIGTSTRIKYHIEKDTVYIR